MSTPFHSRAALVAALALASSGAVASAIDDDFNRYVTGAESVVAALETGEAPASQQAELQSLADVAAKMIPPFSERYPECRAYLDAASALREQWSTLSLEVIERDYHHDGVLPAPADARSRALCYQMKDLLVHPLTALRLLQEPMIDVASVKHEIVEVVAHGRALAALMK